ncbi:hypothetical protein, partial [Deinococcus sp. ME38]|uniref:hypothetical protein n=1 Tax=Deinococcus sp. ME38 TaxID=3400344 RepID=UPI003B5A1C29
MCVSDSAAVLEPRSPGFAQAREGGGRGGLAGQGGAQLGRVTGDGRALDEVVVGPVYYSHLTLPTTSQVSIPVVVVSVRKNTMMNQAVRLLLFPTKSSPHL